MDEPFIGTIIFVPYDFPPNDWAFCAGQLLPISQNLSLFSLIGTIFGGNGQTTFALPDLRGRFPIGYGQGLGLPTINIGEVSGYETVTLIQSQIPAHSHTGTVKVGSGLANSANGAGNNFAANTGVTSIYNSNAAGDSMATNLNINATGGNQSHNNMSPYLVLNCCICWQGLFPSQS